MTTDSRRELRNLQSELTSLDDANPRRSEIQVQISDLLRMHGANWAGPRAKASWKQNWDDVDETRFVQQFGPAFGAEDQWQFQNGQLEICSTSMSEFLVHGDAIRNQTNLQELTLHGIGGQGLVNMRKARVKKYKRLNAPDHILDSEMRGLASAEQCCPLESFLDCEALLGIKSLRFEQLALFDKELEVFAGAPFLKEVESLYLNVFSDCHHAMYRKLGQLPHLQHLDIEFRSDSDGDRAIDVGNAKDARCLAASPALRNLRTLRLRYHEIGDEGMLALAGSQHLANLQTLDLRGNYSSITSSGLARLADMPEVARLRSLNLSQCGFDDEGVLALARSPHLQALDELRLAPMEDSYENWNEISGDEFAVELCKPDCLPALRRLDISHQMIGDAGIQALANAPRFANFQNLVLRHQGMTDEGLFALATSPYQPKLKELNLRWNDFSDSGIAALCQSPLAQGIEVLYLDGTPNIGSLLANSRFDSLVELGLGLLDDSILEQLADSPSLKSLRRLIHRSRTVPGEMLQRKKHAPVYLLREGS